jgi:hypothetical protein
MIQKFSNEGRPFPPGNPVNDGHSDATHHMRDVSGPPADPKGTALSTAKQNAQ